jgi:serine/threonine protein kinase
MQSTNGTQINDVSISSPTHLHDGDQINVGETTFTWVVSEQAAAKDPLINQKIGGYLIRQRLGRGGMGTVYLAHQLSLKRNVAIKILDPRLGKDQIFIKRFVEEARASATLNHPNILQVYDVGVEGQHSSHDITSGTVRG